MYIYSGGTEVTVTGRNLDSVANPRINLTVVVKRVLGEEVTKSPATSSLEVQLKVLNILHCLCMNRPICHGIMWPNISRSLF